MMPAVCLLCLLLCCGWYVDETLGTADNPGLKIRLSQRGLNYAARLVVQRLVAKVHGTSLPDQSGKVHVPVICKVNYKVNYMKITSFQQPSSTVSINAGRGLTWSLSGASVSIHGDWRLKYRLFVKVSDDGSFDASVSGASISVSMTLGATPAGGEPTIRTTGCSCHIDRLTIRLRGGASWLYNLFIGSVERNLRNNLEGKICEAAQNAVNTDAARELATLPVKVALGHDKRWLLDYRLVSAPAFSSGYLESFHKGEFFDAGDTSTEAPFQPSALPSLPTVDHMATFWASSYVVNTAGYVLQKRGVLRYNLTNLLEQLSEYLNTTGGFLAGCIRALVLPLVRIIFRNVSVEAEMFSTASPTAEINPEKLTASFAGVTVLRARLSDGSLAHLFGMGVTAKIAVAPRLDGGILKATVISMEDTVELIDSSVGPIPHVLVRLAFDVVKTAFIIPKLNEAGEMGLPLPVLKHVQFINTELQLEHDSVRVSTDVTHSSSTTGVQNVLKLNHENEWQKYEL